MTFTAETCVRQPLNAAAPNRRAHHRQRITSLVYVKLDHHNGGIIRDLSEHGMAIQAVSPLHPDQAISVRFDLVQPRVHVETLGRVAWSDARGEVGIKFENLPERPRRLIRQWVFHQLLARAQQVCENAAEFSLSPDCEQASELRFSAPPRPTIRLQPPLRPAVSSAYEESFDAAPLVPRFRFFVAPRLLSQCVDGAILLVALIFFSGFTQRIIETVPAWPITVSSLLAAGSLFALAYWGLSAVCIGETPGALFARISAEPRTSREEEDRPRFR